MTSRPRRTMPVRARSFHPRNPHVYMRPVHPREPTRGRHPAPRARALRLGARFPGFKPREKKSQIPDLRFDPRSTPVPY
mgnify:CR=1 FL=1